MDQIRCCPQNQITTKFAFVQEMEITDQNFQKQEIGMKQTYIIDSDTLVHIPLIINVTLWLI